jgi:protein O-GlcNAc transferase
MLKWIKRAIANNVKEPAPPEAKTAPPQPTTQPLKKQGDELVRAGRYADAEQCYRQVKDSDPQYRGAVVMLGFVLRAQGRLNEARAALERAVFVAPEDPDGHYLLACVLETTGPLDLEISHLRKAVQLRPGFELACKQLIVALMKSGGPVEEATKVCEDGLASTPDSAELHFFRSNLYRLNNDKAAAISSCRRALALNSRLMAAQASLSQLLLDTQQLEQAEISCRREIELNPQSSDAWHRLGAVLHLRTKYSAAIESFERAIALNPGSAVSYASLANAYLGLDDTSEAHLELASANLQKAVALEPANSQLHCGLGSLFWRKAQYDRSLASFDRAIEADPGSAKARWARIMLWAPPFPSLSPDGSPARSRLGAEFAGFEQWWSESDTDGAAFVGELQLFFLSYQEENNRALLEQHGRLCAKVMERWLSRQPVTATRRPPATRIRLGIVSADIRQHSNWVALLEGWFRSFDRERFELVVFSLSEQSDVQTASARDRADVFFAGPKSLPQWVDAIREQNCEILLYSGVGMSPMTLQLASLRLAPVQVNSWGHPDTSGLPTMDYYVSAACLEPSDAQEFYSERLIQLPHLGSRLRPLNQSGGDLDFAALNISLDRPILICPGTPFKYQPEHDHVFAEIVQRVPDAQLVFFLRPGEALSNIVRARIAGAFAAAGLDVTASVRFIRWLSFGEFHHLLRRADVMLDTIGFSGYNTAAQAIECGLPLVTREGRFLRGRLGSGVLRRIDLPELIVPTKEAYVDLAVRLVTDRPYQAHIRGEIERRRSVLFNDQSAMQALQDFLESVARPTGQSAPPSF